MLIIWVTVCQNNSLSNQGINQGAYKDISLSHLLLNPVDNLDPIHDSPLEYSIQQVNNIKEKPFLPVSAFWLALNSYLIEK